MKTKITLILFSVFLLLSLYGVRPFLTWAESVMVWTKDVPALANDLTEGKQSPTLETFSICGRSYTLTKKWIEEGQQELRFNSKTPPYILTVKAEVKTSPLALNFNPFVYHNDSATEGGILGLPHTVCDGAFVYQLQQEGNYTIKISASGYKWYAKIGQ